MSLTFQPHSSKERSGLGIMKHTKPETQDSSNKSVSGTVTVSETEPTTPSVPTETKSSKSVDSSKVSQDSKPKVQNSGSSKSLRPKPFQKPQLKCELCYYINHSTDNCYRIPYCMVCKREDRGTSDHEMYTASLKKSKNYKARPYQYASYYKHILKAKAKPFPPCTHCGFNDHRPNDCRNYIECEICGSYDHFTSGHNCVNHIRGRVLAESSQSSESSIGVKCNTCGSTVHSTTDHNEYDHFKIEFMQRHIMEPIWYLDSGCSRSVTSVKSYLHKYVEQPGPKVVFGDNSSCITEGYGSINCKGIVFTKVAFVNGLKYNLISIGQLCDAKYTVQFDDKQGTIFNANKEIVLIAPRRNDVYVLDMSSLTPNKACFFSKASKSVNWLWHKRLSHLNFKNINKLAKQNKVLGLPSLSMEAIRFTNTSKDEIGIDDSSRYPPNEFLHEDNPSRQYQVDFDVLYYVIPHRRSLTELTQENHVPKVIALNELDIPLTEDNEGPPDLINTEGTHGQNVQNEQITTQSTKGPSGNNNEISVSINESLVPNVPQSHISNQASTSSHPTPRDRWSKDQHIELVDIIGDPGEGMLTRSMAAKLTTASASECLFVDFLSEIEPKKVSEVLKHPRWVDAMQEELNQFYKNKVCTLVPLSYGKTSIGSKWVFRNKKDEHVARIEAIRIFIAFATYMNFKVYQMDVKSAFLNGKLKEEVYVKQPPGFESSEFPDHVYVDDIIFGSTSYKLCKQFEKLMTKKFEIKQYTRNLLKKYKISDSSSVKTPMVPPNNLGPNLAGKPINETSYRRMIRSLMYLTAIRLDIQFSTVLCARYQSNLKESHLTAVKRILRYLKGTPILGLYYPKCSGFDLKGYSDSDYAGLAMSSAEAEYVAAAGCCASIIWMKSQLNDYDIHYKMVPIFCDNTSAISISNNSVLHSRTKHADIRYHFIRDHILKGDIELHSITIEYQLADIFTKPMDEPTFTRLKAELAILQANLQVLDELTTKNGLYKCPSVLYQNFLREFWCTVIAYDPNPSTDENKPRPLKEFLIKFTVMNGKKPLTLNFKTFTTSTGLDYNNGAYVARPSPEVVMVELAKIVTNPSYLDKTLVLKNSFPMAWRILLTFVIQVLGENYSSIEQVNSIQQLITYSLITGTKVDIEEIIYSDHVTKLLNRSRLRYVSYPRFISCALEALLGLEYTQDENFGYLPGILSNSNISKDPSKVTEIELTTHMITVNNQKDSVSPLPLSAKKKKGKSQSVTPTLPKSQGPKAFGALYKKRKQPKPKKTPSETKVSSPKPTVGSEQSHSVSSGTVPDPQDLERNIQLASMGLHSTLDEGTRKSQPLSDGTTTDPKDLGGNDQPADRDLTFMASNEGAAKTTLFPKGPRGDKDSDGFKPPADMEPQTNPVADPSRTDAKYHADQTQSARLRYRSLTENKGKTSYEIELDTEAFLLSDDDMVQESDDDVFETGEDTDEDTRVMKKNISLHHQTQTSLNLLIKKLKNQNLTPVLISRSLTTFCHSLKGALKAIQDAVKENPTLHKKVIEATEAYTKNLNDLLTLIKNFDFQGLKSSVTFPQTVATSQDKHLAELAKSSTSIA
ncbi:retrovirus-related pol polyprotein from transposon TNT 1-94 [Tanacetum coccineum]